MSVTYLAINWSEAWRLTTTYGYASPISRELYRRWLDRRRPGLAILDQLEALGARKIVVRGPANKKGQPGKEILFSAGAVARPVDGPRLAGDGLLRHAVGAHGHATGDRAGKRVEYSADEQLRNSTHGHATGDRACERAGS